MVTVAKNACAGRQILVLSVSAGSVYCGVTCQTKTRLGDKDKQDLLLKQGEDFQGAAEVCNRASGISKKGNSDSTDSPRI